MPSCCLLNCKARKSVINPEVTLHRFPQNDLLRRLWLKALIGQELNPQHKVVYICSRHFEEKCFKRSSSVIRLQEDAVPTLFYPRFRVKGVKRNYTGENVNVTYPEVRLVDCTKNSSTTTDKFNVKEEIHGVDDSYIDEDFVNSTDDHDIGSNASISSAHEKSCEYEESVPHVTVMEYNEAEASTAAPVSVDPLSIQKQKHRRFKYNVNRVIAAKLINSLKEKNLERKKLIRALRAKVNRQSQTIAKLREPNGLHKDSLDQSSSSKPVVIGYVCDDVTEKPTSSGTSKKIPYLDKKELKLRRVNNVYDNPVYELVSNDEAGCKENKSKQNTDQSKVEKNIGKLDNEYWKLKLSYILNRTHFCGLCLTTPDKLNGINDEFDMFINGSTHRRTLYEIVQAIFNEVEDVLSNSRICNKCKTSLIESYIFIENTKYMSKMLNYHLTELYNKSCYIQNTILNDSAAPDVRNVVFSLENTVMREVNTEMYIDEEKETIDNEDIKPNFFKCMKCNISLSSYKKWKIHKETHKNSGNKCRICHQTFKTSQLLTKHFTVHFRTKCMICQGLVQDGGLLTHLKKCHMSSIHMCPKCDVVFYTPVSLEAHKYLWHGEGEYECVNCRKNFHQHDLAKHKCRFACPDHRCGEPPCVHQEYITSYREQTLSPSPLAKCPDCHYVCSDIGRFISHVNDTHIVKQAQ